MNEWVRKPGKQFFPLNKAQRWVMIVAMVVVSAGAVTGFIFGDDPESSKPSKEMANDPVVQAYVQALEIVEANHVSPPDKFRMAREAILGMLHSLDPHSGFYDRREFSEMQDEQSSHFYGIGVTVNQRNERIYVLGVSPGMPAEQAGLRYGDAIIAVDEISAKDWTQSDALKHVRGEYGTTVAITVERAGEPKPLTFNIKRDEVPFPSVRNSFMIRPDVGYIGLTGGFNQETSEELSDAIERLKKEGMTSLLLDLRDNPGGLLRQAIQVAETFLPRGVEIVSVRGRDGRYQPQMYRSENSDPETMPMVVLINSDTASASEIVAGAMQDKGRAWIVGEESFGKGLVQTVFRLRGGTGLALTTARYFTPSGRLIQRPYDNLGIYDYFYARREQPQTGRSSSKTIPATAPAKEAREGDKFYTSTGQEVFAGGGIKPDTEVKMPLENFKLRDACFEFARLLVAGIVPNFPDYKVKKLDSGTRFRTSEIPLPDSVLAAFKDFLRQRPELQIKETDVARHLDYVRLRIRAEIITAHHGPEFAGRFLLENDQQATRGLSELPKAKQLSDQARLFSRDSSKQ
ncbi:MAG: S41 family peptidase [Acidobacteria bacterium]|nr:S41 family peptidase [Acidobacteriota bacterium]